MAKRNKGKGLILSVFQLNKEPKHDDKTFLVVIKEVQSDAPSVVPEVLVSILKYFTEMILMELPR